MLILALAVRGLQLPIGPSGQISLGHGAYFAVGADTAGVLRAQQRLPSMSPCPRPWQSADSSASSSVCQRPGWRALSRVGLLHTRCRAAAASEASAAGALTGGVSGLSLAPPAALLGIEFLQPDAWNLLLTAAWTALIYGVLRRLLNGPAGLAWITLRDYPTAALAVGVEVRKWRATAFAVSAATVGAAGALNTGLTHFVSPDSFPIFLSLSLLVGVALAGPSSSVGTFVAAVSLSFVPDVAEKLSQELTGVLYGAVMLGAMFVLPLPSKWRGRMAVSDRAAALGLNPIDRKEK